MIRQLKDEGMSISAISRETGLNRRTVRRRLAQDRPPEYTRAPRKSILDPYKPYIEARLKEYDLTAVRLLEEVRKQGYTGQESIVRAFCASVRKKQVLQAVVRFESKPGGQGQVDWADFGKVQLDGHEHKLTLFVMVLGYSRMKYVEFVIDTSTASLIQCHLNAFAYFGGYTREILYDNMKQVVLERREKPDQIQWTPLFEDFVKHHGFLPRLCRPYRAQTKGKVENAVKFVRSNFFEGRLFESLQDLNTQARAWADKVNQRKHDTTKQPPIERLSHENLLRLDEKPPYTITQTFYRKVSRECFVSYLGNSYSVPWKHALREAVLRVREGRLLVEVGGETVAEHHVHPGSGHVARNPTHFAGLLKATRERIQQPKRVHVWKSAPIVEQRSLTVYDHLLSEYPGA